MKLKKLMLTSFLVLSLSIISCNEQENVNNYNIPMEKLWGYNDLARFDNYLNLRSFYGKIDSIYSSFNNGEINPLTITVDKSKDSYHMGTYSRIYKLEYNTFSITKSDAAAVVKIYSLDHPNYYWISDDILVNDNHIALTCDEAYDNKDVRKETDDKINLFVSSLKSKMNDDFTDYDIVKTIHNYILDNATYEEDNTFESHNIVGIARDGKGVCEAYAKTFQYLAYLYNIDCILAVGNAKTAPGIIEPHAWNLVKLDNKWYGVDTTFDDSLNVRDSFLLTKEQMLDVYFPSEDNSLEDEQLYTYILPDVCD